MQVGVVEWVTRDIRRILAPNPSAMTGPGTNTYVLGQGKDLVVLDPGPDDPAHLAAVLAALTPQESIGAIVVSHAHRDHSAGAPLLCSTTGAPVLAFGDAGSGRSATMRRLASSGLVAGGEGVDHAFRPDALLQDGDILSAGSKELRVLHTPGHMGGHICLALEDVLLSGDHAMGWSSSLISPPDGDMRDYTASLVRLSRMPWRLMLPGHGDAVFGANARLIALIQHRRKREAEIMTILDEGPTQIDRLTDRIYHDLPPTLRSAAQRNILAHLIDLSERKLIFAEDFLTNSAIFRRKFST